MSEMKKIVFLICILSVVISCKKGKADFVLKGIVTDNTFSTNHSGANVNLYQVPAGTSQQELIASSTIGVNGEYSFTFPRDKMDKFILKVTKSGYFDIESDVYFSELTIEEENIKNLSTTAKSWVKLTFLNTNPSPTDQLKYIKQEGKENCAECCTDTEQNYYGALDTSIYCINDGNTNYSYYYWTIQQSTNQGLKTAYTTAFDTTELILNY